MTKKHFIKLAAALKGCRPEPANPKDDIGLDQWQDDVNAVADVCASTNERFDRDKFLTACGAK